MENHGIHGDWKIMVYGNPNENILLLGFNDIDLLQIVGMSWTNPWSVEKDSSEKHLNENVSGLMEI